MPNTEQQVVTFRNLQQASRVLDSLLEARVRAAADLSLAEYEALFRLQRASDHHLQMSEIASLLINSPSGMTRIADRLEKDGLISRETPRDNRRVVVMTLTAKGRRKLERADKAYLDALGESFGNHMTPGDLADLRRLMRKLLESNGAWSDVRCGLGTPAAS